MKLDILKHRKGQALVETAFVLFVLVLFTFAITEFGRAMYIKNMLNNAARAGARQAVVTGSLALPLYYNTFATRPDASTDPVGAKIYDSIMYVENKALVSADITCTAGCSGSNAVSGATIKVSVTSPFTPVVDLFKDKIKNTLVGEASMRYE